MTYPISPPPTPAGAGGSGVANKRVAKSVDSLKPDQLTKSMKPTEFRHWRQRFDDWYATSCFDAMAMEGQIAFLRSAIESELSEPGREKAQLGLATGCDRT